MTRPRAKELGFGALWVALAILAAVAAFTYRSIDATAETLAWVETTHRRVQQVEEVSAAYARAASARRAYIVTGDASQLEAVPDLDARTDRALANLRASMAGRDVQAESVALLGDLIHQRLQTLDAATVERRSTGSSVETPEGLAETARIRAVRESIEREENAQLTERDARTRRDVRTTKITEVAGTGVSFAILLLVFGRLREEVIRRRDSERALRMSEDFLDSIVENIPNMIVVKDAQNLEVKRINQAAETWLGMSRQELVGKTAHAFGVGEPAAVASQVRDRATLDGNVIVEDEPRLFRAKGGERWIRTKRVPVLDEEGGPRYVLSISDDVTEERAAALSLKAARDAAEAANKELESFSYSVAHDLRAPLRAIEGFSQALEEDCAAALDDEGRGFLKRIRAAAVQMAQLIDGLLGLARVSRGSVDRVAVDLSRVAHQLALRQRETQPERTVECVIAEGGLASCDPRLMGAALENLLGNAWKFTRHVAAPRVEFGFKTEAGETIYFVKDNGAGFDQTYAPKLFGAFQRLHSASEFEGSGIGLANVQRIVQRHGGRVWAEGAVGQGATFYFTLGGSKVSS